MNLFDVLPELNGADFANILPSLERSQITVSDLLTLDPLDCARRAQIPLREVRRLHNAVVAEFSSQYSAKASQRHQTGGSSLTDAHHSSGVDLVADWGTISLLDDALDAALQGGIPTGYLTEITGESGVGKTQFTLTLLLSVQLPKPHGLSRSALYLSSEAPLSTSRLSQMIHGHPLISSLATAVKPSLSNIRSIQTPDLESQEHILRYQVPVAIKHHNVGLLVIDSITANYRAEFDRRETGPSAEKIGATMARRTSQLTEMGELLRNIARTQNVAVVVTNQVADRFDNDEDGFNGFRSQSDPQSFGPISHSSPGPVVKDLPSAPNGRSLPSTQQQPREGFLDVAQNPLTLAHQQRFFTGWGDDPPNQLSYGIPRNLKTPSLGLIWTNQIGARIALVRTPYRTGNGKPQRSFRVVFAPWTAPSVGSGIRFEVTAGGLVSIGDAAKTEQSSENALAARDKVPIRLGDDDSSGGKPSPAP